MTRSHKHFPLATADVQSLLWSPCGRYLVVTDSIIQYGCHIYSPLGPLLHSLTPSSSSLGQDPGLGIRTTVWAPGGRWLALGGWDGSVRIMESEGGRCIATMTFAARTVERETVTWREPANWLQETRGRGIVQCESGLRLLEPDRFILTTVDRSIGPTPIPSIRPELSRAPPRSGVSQLCFDAEGTLLLVRLETQPCVAHIITFLPAPTSTRPEMKHLAALVLTEPIRSSHWCSGRQKLAISTKSGAVYFWDGDGDWVEDGESSAQSQGGLMEGVGVPTASPFVAGDLLWAPDGNALAMLDRTHGQFCVVYDDQGTGDQWDHEEGLTHVSEEDEAREADETERSMLAQDLWLGSRPKGAR